MHLVNLCNANGFKLWNDSTNLGVQSFHVIMRDTMSGIANATGLHKSGLMSGRGHISTQ